MPSPSDPATNASGPHPEAGSGFGPPRPWLLLEASYGDLLDRCPTLALLPWGAGSFVPRGDASGAGAERSDG
jgi:hypothetical protein